MKSVSFIVNLLPEQNKFKVQVVMGDRRIVELMTIARFLRFARSDAKIRIGGYTIEFKDDVNGSEKAIRAYFKKVADSYVAAKYRNN